MTRKISEILDAAADLIEPEGAWGQHRGYYWSRDGKSVPRRDADCYCMVGAITVAGDLLSPAAVEFGEIGRLLEQLIRPADLNDGEGGQGLFVWNDAPERTQPEVVAKLREAATLARSNGQ